MTKKIKFMCTAFRDGFQSVYGARVLTNDFLPALEAARDAGISYFEAGGGARFQSLYFYCNEDAFVMMDTFRKTAGPDADLQTLARGVNVVGLDSQSSDIIRLHAKLFKKHGITTIRNFDALNDVRNLVFSGKCITEEGLKHQVCITMMELPPGCTGAHDPDFYTARLSQILDAEIPFDSICFKDASGTAVPSKIYETIKRARKLLPDGTFIHFHTHETGGIGVIANKAALDGGADAIDLSMAPCSGGTCQIDILVMWHALRGTNFELDVDIDKVRKAEEVFKACMSDYFLPPEATAVEPLIPWSPMPGGALTANTQMLRDNGIMDKYPEIIKAMSEVVIRGGYGTSVTPVSQFYFQQAFNNVMFGPWKKIAPDYGKMVLGYFGKTPIPADPEIIKIAAEQLEMESTQRSPIEMNDEDPEKSIDHAQKALKSSGIEETDENIFIVATCKDRGLKFLKGEAELGIRKIEKNNVPEASAKDKGHNKKPSSYIVTVNRKDYPIRIEGDTATINNRSYKIGIRRDDESKPKELAEGTETPGTDVIAQMPGKVIRLTSRIGDYVHHGQSIMVVEAMKMEINVSSPIDGTVTEIKVAEEDLVKTGQVLAILN
ncbi:MAG: biotin/lipoyl-binding protein [Candidatus Scalindua sp. AMX11]|nr:MAG: biotin/lipoyl-binding protein [Candidatus Scalindua sp.]NOG83381.1 biotin attachment protein [Planctomycetota bacterium]RZV65543.1 MAG: biotin/lipoyl-binding protein [Candidatus Scalindua sp. SCAELEC01]TDE63530.1 MAG: biotin/lipoyl-binding protein [Candidatus Scalindua sp. AMX11]GJQ60585.1 MAG: biotin attachment protein [Candidatus Scalindua sp.]